MNTESGVLSVKQDAKILLRHLAQHPELKSGISEAADATEVAALIGHLPQEGRRLLAAMTAAPPSALEEAVTGEPELSELRQWLLTYRAPLAKVARLLRRHAETLGFQDVLKNPIQSIGCHSTYYPGDQLAMAHMEFRGLDGETLLENVEPVSCAAKTATSILIHVAGAYGQLREAGCSLAWHDKQEDLDTLAKALAAIRQIARHRGIPFRAVEAEARKGAEPRGTPAVGDEPDHGAGDIQGAGGSKGPQS